MDATANPMTPDVEQGQDERKQCPFVSRSCPIWLKNTSTEKEMYDTLHKQACKLIKLQISSPSFLLGAHCDGLFGVSGDCPWSFWDRHLHATSVALCLLDHPTGGSWTTDFGRCTQCCQQNPILCEKNVCAGALMAGQSVPRPPGTFRTKAEVWEAAQTFLNDYYKQLGSEDTAEHSSRLKVVHDEIKEKGIYDLTKDEIRYGARLAWRNAARCVARIHWNSLEVFDCRHVKTAKEMFEELKKHVEWGTNGGNIRVAITVFPAREEGKEDFRVWSGQFFQYAGYKNPDGTYTGDPAKVDFTKVCQELGWKSARTDFDVLPLVLSASGEKPQFFDLPKELVLEVPFKHPKYPWFEDLGLRWYAMPAVADMLLDVGGIEFPAAPFNGWYTSPEIGSRNLCDPHRYNILEKVAKKMGLDTSDNDSLWKDRALVQVNLAVLHSFQSQGVSIVDHHTVAESFLTYMEQEQKLRGGTNADWVWLVPPLSGSTVPTFHQQMVNYCLKPSYEYQNKIYDEYPELLEDTDLANGSKEEIPAEK